MPACFLKNDPHLNFITYLYIHASLFLLLQLSVREKKAETCDWWEKRSEKWGQEGCLCDSCNAIDNVCTPL